MRRALIPLVTFALGFGCASPGDAPRPHADTETPSQGAGRGELPELLVRVQDDIRIAAIDCLDDTRYHDPRVCLALDTCNAEPDYRLANRHC